MKKTAVMVLIGVLVGASLTGAAWLASRSLAGAGGAGAGGAEAAVVARVDGSPITELDFVDALKKTGGAETLDRLINERLVLAAAEKEKLDITDQALDEELENVKRSWGNQDAFEKALEFYKISLDDVKREVKVQLVLERMASKDLDMSEDKLRAYYDAHASDFNGKPYEEVKDQVRRRYVQENGKQFQTIIEDLRGKSKIDITWDGYPKEGPHPAPISGD